MKNIRCIFNFGLFYDIIVFFAKEFFLYFLKELYMTFESLAREFESRLFSYMCCLHCLYRAVEDLEFTCMSLYPELKIVREFLYEIYEPFLVFRTLLKYKSL